MKGKVGAMFKRFKSWLRATIAEEVAKVEVSLVNERSAALRAFSQRAAEIHGSLNAKETELGAVLDARIKQTLETEYTNFVSKLRDSFRDAQRLEPPSHWRADEETLARDHALRKTQK